ncbi:uncharacterized protein LOC126670171 [Mercurialis annua]|uniref:uncharacterized protein LOC126670171 n=1 Tax=Mercurialis annua TaxID=3986 RepID=UPI00215F21B2|nr:uncharacterized protein LOC126670171 [Mercurialis annua]
MAPFSKLLLTISIFFFFLILDTKAARLAADDDQISRKMFESLLEMKFPNDMNRIDEILPGFVGHVSARKDTLTWEASCFRNNHATLEFNNRGKYGGGTLHIHVSEARWYEWYCSNIYIFATPFNIHHDEYWKKGEHKVEFLWQEKAEYEFVKRRGISIFVLPSGPLDTVVAIDDFRKLFENSDEGEKANVQFLKDYMNVSLEERPHPWVTANINPDDIRSGDFLALSKIRGQSGGFESLEKWVTGSYAGHSAVCLRNPEGKLFVAESGRTIAGKDVVDVLPWEEWWDFEQSNDEGNPHIALLPLHPDVRAKFNETAAWEYAISLKGNPYGYHNVIFSWIDTPKQNYPSRVDAHLVAAFMVMWNTINSNSASRLWNEALNKRLGTQGLDFPGILVETEERGLNFSDILAIPELDHWEYTDGKSVSCVAYVIRIYKAAGIFHPITNSIQATEFMVRDGYQVKLYEDDTSRLPKWCNNEKDKIKQPFCQIRGKYRMDLPGYNTIEPYPNMNERCPSLPPSYEREPKNC